MPHEQHTLPSYIYLLFGKRGDRSAKQKKIPEKTRKPTKQNEFKLLRKFQKNVR